MNPPALASRDRSTTRSLAAYFLIAFGVTWLSILAFVASRSFRFDRLSVEDGLLIFAFMCLGPFTGGLVMTFSEGRAAGLRDLMRRIRGWRVPLGYWALALLTSPLVTVVVLVVLGATVSPAFAPEARLAGLFIGLVAGAFEEIGWTGFATPRLLRRRSPLIAGLVLGLIWALWHTFADFTGNIAAKGSEGWLVWFVTYWLIPLTGYRVLMTLVYSRTGSVLLAMAMHASWTGWQFVLTPASTTQSQDVVWHLLVSAGIWAVVLAAALLSRLMRPPLMARPVALGAER